MGLGQGSFVLHTILLQAFTVMGLAPRPSINHSCFMKHRIALKNFYTMKNSDSKELIYLNSLHCIFKTITYKGILRSS